MMGQTSSQITPPSGQQQAPETDHPLAETGRRKRTHKKGKKRDGSVPENADGEESGRALMQMPDEAVNHVRRPSSADYDLAASSQLMNETYNSQPHVSAGKEIPSKKRKRGDDSGKKRRKKHLEDGNGVLLEDDIASSTAETQFEAADAPEFPDSTVEEQGIRREDGHQSLHALDEIRSDDGDVASLLQDYEGEGVSSYLFNDLPNGSGAQIDDGLGDFIPDSSPPPALYQASSGYYGNRKTKRKRHAAPFSDIPVEQGQTSPGVTGQQTFDIDFELFDEFCATTGVGPANIFDDTPGQALPIDPSLMDQDDELADTANGNVPTPEDRASPMPAQEGKRRRTSSRSKRHQPNYTEPSVPLVGNDSLFDSFDLLNDFQSDQVLPGFEDMQRQSSQEHRHSRASSTDSNYQRQSDDSSVSHTARRKASRPKNTPSQNHQELPASSPPAEEEAPKPTGAYSNAEISDLEAFRDSYCDEHNVSPERFNELIQSLARGNAKVTSLFQEIYETLPNRTNHSLRRFCKRRFHNFSVRGAWTAEDDELLEQAVEEKGKSWVAVGQMMGRFEEDVRDRWRNYHVNKDTRNREFWSDAEVRNLVMAVDQCANLMRQAKQQAFEAKYAGRDLPEEGPNLDDPDDANLINWQVVSDRMGATRSRLQCSFKWSHLKDADRRRFRKEIKAALRAQQKADRAKKPPKKSWRQKKSLKRIQEMRPGDKRELLEALSRCGVDKEKSIPWQDLGDPEFRARWTTSDKKIAWKAMKEEVPGADHMDYEDVVNGLMMMQMDQVNDNLYERYDPEVHGYTKAHEPPKSKAQKAELKEQKLKQKMEKDKQKRKVKSAKKPYKAPTPKIKSELYVAESDDEAVGQRNETSQDRDSTIQSTSDSRRSSDGSGNRAHGEESATATTADTSIDGYDDQEIPRSRQDSEQPASHHSRSASPNSLFDESEAESSM